MGGVGGVIADCPPTLAVSVCPLDTGYKKNGPVMRKLHLKVRSDLNSEKQVGN